MSWRALLQHSVFAALGLALALLLGGAGMARADVTAPAWPALPDQIGPIAVREVCVPAGSAVTVINRLAVLAEAMPSPIVRQVDGTAPRVTDTDIVKIAVDGPVRVGACAEYDGFWAERSAGSAEASLALYRDPVATDSATAAPLARDEFKDSRSGPSHQRAQLKALVRLSEPGTYSFVSILTATARKPSTAPTPGQMSTDTWRLRIGVVVRGQAGPSPEPRGSISGVVTDADGRPVIGAGVSALGQVGADAVPVLGAPAHPSLPSAGTFTQSAVPGAIGGGLTPLQDSASGRTDEHGRYTLSVLQGRYVVVARAAGFRQQWYRGRDVPEDAEAIDVGPGAAVEGIDFVLAAEAATPVPEPEPTYDPAPDGTISGAVSGPDAPIEGALVVARTAPQVAGGSFADADPIGTGPIARTGADGRFVLSVPPGAYVVRAEADGFVGEWFDNAARLENASRVLVESEKDASGVDFLLDPLPTEPATPVPPVPPDMALVAGAVLAGDQPLAGALVYAIPGELLRRDPVVPPGSPLPFPTGGPPPAITLADGTYEMHVMPGEYVFAVLLARASTGPVVQFFDHKTKLQDADIVVLAPGEERTDIDFQLF